MPSNGAGVNLDNAGVPQRLTYYDDANADAQNDGNLNFEYDLHKIWACMGRVGVNGVMRVGFVEEGDPYLGAPAGHIEENAGGVFVNLERWNSLLGYNPLGGLAANDYCIFGALAPFTGLALHLDVALAAQPAFVAEFYNGAWNPLTMTVVPDFTLANGQKLQRCEWILPNWVGAAFALGGGVNGNAYYHMRLKLTAPIGVAPVANTAYKDWLYGHFKFFFCEWDIKRGDDTAGSAATTFRHEGNFGLRLRAERQLDGNRANQTQPVTVGKRYALSNRNAYGAPWYVASTRLGSGYRAHRFYGGSMVGRPQSDAAPAICNFLGAGGIGELVDMQIAGFGEVRIGAAGTGALELVNRLNVAPSVTGPANMNSINGAGISSTGRAEDIIVTKPKGQSQDIGFKQNVNASTRMQGLAFTHDDYNVGQIQKAGTGIMDLFDHKWGGPNKKVAAGVAEVREWRRLPFEIHDADLGVAPPAGIPFRITDSSGFVQTESTLDANGNSAFLNLYPNAPISGVQNQNIVLASGWFDSIGTETVLDSDLLIEINPDTMAGFNYDFETLAFRYSFPRVVMFDPVSLTFQAMQWQRADGTIALGLKRRAVTPIMVDDLFAEAAFVERIQASVPEAA